MMITSSSRLSFTGCNCIWHCIPGIETLPRINQLVLRWFAHDSSIILPMMNPEELRLKAGKLEDTHPSQVRPLKYQLTIHFLVNNLF
jgi:hypothetical protein